MPQPKKIRSAPFVATVTPSAIEKGNTAKGVRYTKLVGATIDRKGRPSMIRTVMAFGRNNAEVARSLRAGKPVDLLCEFDGGSIRIRGKAPKAAAE